MVKILFSSRKKASQVDTIERSVYINSPLSRERERERVISENFARVVRKIRSCSVSTVIIYMFFSATKWRRGKRRKLKKVGS